MANREQIFAEKIADGGSIKQSMIDAGYPESRANKGLAGCSKRMIQAVAEEGIELAAFGKSLSLDTLKYIAIGRLAANAIEGRDGGVMSAKTLGSHRELNLWTPESMAGIIVITPPNQAVQNADKTIDAEESNL
jgi:hypothetical protein